MGAILVFVDSAPRRRHVAAAVARAGHRAQEAASGEQALAIIGAGRLDLLLVDILTPHPGGYQFVCELYARRDLALPRMVFLAAPHMAGEARLLAQVSGFSGAVVDVADAAALRAAVDAALSRPPPAARLRAPGRDRLYPLVSRLCGRVADLESCNARLHAHATLHAAQLQVARSALDREVVKRLASEEHLARQALRLREHAVRDPLTGLYNRRYLEASLPREEGRAKREGAQLGVTRVDIDDFRRCRESFGRAACDEVLRAVGRRLAGLARGEDIVCRCGEAKFALAMVIAAAATLKQRAEALCAETPKLRIEHDGRPLGPVTLSIALAFFPHNGDSAYTVLQVADAALQQSQATARNRVVVAGARH